MEENNAMNRPISRFRPVRPVCAALLVCALLLSCGLTAFAAEEGSQDSVQPTAPSTVATPLPLYPEDMTDGELYPAKVWTGIEDGTRQIVKTYILTAEQGPNHIPRDSFIRDGRLYQFTDITEKRSNSTDTRNHTETVAVDTDTQDVNEIMKLLAPTLDYRGEDGYCGLLTLDMAAIHCEAAGYKNSSYTVTVTREYPHLSTNDLSLIPKTITDNGRTLALDDVAWEVQHTVSVDYEDIPDSYRAVAKYSAKASKRVVTGYITTAKYNGDVSRTVRGDTVYTVYFSGNEVNPAPKPTEPPATTAPPTTAPPVPGKRGISFPTAPFLIGLAIVAALLTGAGVCLLHHNIKNMKGRH
jgi:hypothetical protein